MSLPMKEIREKAELTQLQLAERMSQVLGEDISQVQISRYEDDPDSVPLRRAMCWLSACGLSLDQASHLALGLPAVKPLDPGDPYVPFNRRLDLLRQYVDEGPLFNPENVSSPYLPELLVKRISAWKRKPVVVLAGRFDSGKTRIANALLGTDVLPSRYQPMTKVINFIRHSSERPPGEREDVWILGENEGKPFNPADWADLQKCATHKVVSGSYDTLRKYGTRERKEEELATAAVVFFDAPILRSCTLVDLPGYEASEGDDENLANQMAGMADILVYTSPAKTFLPAADLMRLSVLLRSLPILEQTDVPLSNLLVVATQADPSINDLQLESEVLQVGSERLYTHVGDTVLKTRYEGSVSPSALRNRFCTFWFEDQRRRDRMESELRKLLAEVFPAEIASRVNAELQEIKRGAKESYSLQINAYEQTILKLEEARSKLMELETNEPARLKDIQERSKKVKDAIETSRTVSLAALSQVVKRWYNIEDVTEFLTNKAQFPKKTRASDAFAKVLENIQSEMEEALKTEADKVSEIIKEYLTAYDEMQFHLSSQEFGQFVGVPFDARGAFAGGLAGLASLGALSAWAAAMGNLGGYILVAKFAGVLAALGIGINSAALVGIVAAIGGPAIIGVGIALLVGKVFSALFGEAWQRTLAKKIVKNLQEKGLEEKLRKAVSRYWDDTLDGFGTAAAAVERQYAEYVKTLRHLLLDTNSRTEIEALIGRLEELKDFFAGIPWRSSS
jgi:transcriptional regulator with XRE-family HTH domain